MYRTLPSAKFGFTLLELAIVLAVLALIIGGIMGGRSMLRNAELSSILTEKSKYSIAVLNFEETYSALPGDMPHAYDDWGTQCGTNTTNGGTGCNGDGDGEISASAGESVKAWEHLSRAKMTEALFDGAGAHVPGRGTPILATNSPQSKFPKGFWAVAATSDTANGFGPNIAGDRTIFSVGLQLAESTGGWSLRNDDLVFPVRRQEAENLDRKIDDGKADKGTMRGNGRTGTSACNDTSGFGNYGANSSLGGDPNVTDCILTFVVK